MALLLLLLLPSIRNRLKLKGWTTWVGINRRHYCDHSISYLGRNCVKYLCTPSMQQSLLRRKKRPAVLKWYIFRNLATTIGDGSFFGKKVNKISLFFRRHSNFSKTFHQIRTFRHLRCWHACYLRTYVNHETHISKARSYLQQIER